jgi:succinylglutamate desuccinylase
MIHSELQGRDYHPLKSQMPIFEMLDGSTLCYKETETIYPVFINEAAYYDKNIAYLSTRKVTLTFSASP